MTSTPSSPETSPGGAPAAPRDTVWKTVALTTLPLLGIALILLAIVVLRPARQVVVTEVLPPESGSAINLGQIIDATVPGAWAEPRLGFRYRLFVEDESEDRSSGIAHLAGRAVFIPDARRGQTVLAEVTRVRERVVDAVLTAVVGQIAMPPKPPRPAWKPRPGDPTADIVKDAVLDVVLTEPSSKNPETEAIARVAGLVVVVQGAPSSSIGERVNVRITDRRERIAFAEPTGKPAGTGPLPEIKKAPRPAAPSSSAPRLADVAEGAVLELNILEPSRKNPDTEGVAKVEGLVIFVSGATEPGSRVKARITSRMSRVAFAESLGPDAPVPAPAP